MELVTLVTGVWVEFVTVVRGVEVEHVTVVSGVGVDQSDRKRSSTTQGRGDDSKMSKNCSVT